MNKNLTAFIVFCVITCLFSTGCGSNEAEKNKAKACGATMRVMMGAIEMYNMDSKTFMTELNENNYKLLKSKGYISKDFDCICPSTNKFEYSSTCDLSDPENDIFKAIKCSKHGTIKDVEAFVKK